MKDIKTKDDIKSSWLIENPIRSEDCEFTWIALDIKNKCQIILCRNPIFGRKVECKKEICPRKYK